VIGKIGGFSEKQSGLNGTKPTCWEERKYFFEDQFREGEIAFLRKIRKLGTTVRQILTPNSDSELRITGSQFRVQIRNSELADRSSEFRFGTPNRRIVAANSDSELRIGRS
jgi:hypothetical protein